MIYIDELKDLRIYKKKFLLPRNGFNKKKGNVAMLLTPNNESSINLLKHPLMINKYYKGYYIEKDVSFMINHENGTISGMGVLEDYIHEEVEGESGACINEGVFSHYKEKIIYNGYKSDVIRVKKYINTKTISDCNKNLKIDIQYPISVTVFKDEPTQASDSKSINISANRVISDEDFEYYCKEEIYTLLIKTVNSDLNPVFEECLVMVLAGTYDQYNGMFGIDKKLINNRAMFCDAIKKFIDDKGYRELIRVIRNNSYDRVLRDYMENNTAISRLFEAKLDPVTKLKRYITYKANRGSKHILNGVNRKIEYTIDTTTHNPEFVEKNDISKKEKEKREDDEETKVDVPTIDYTHPAAADIPVGQVSGASQEESYHASLIDEEFVMTEDYLQTEDYITYFTEASDIKDARLKRILYRERIRTNKQLFAIYDEIKNSCPNITMTYLNINRYKNFNLFVDLRYYNELFFRNNSYKLDKGIDLYYTLLSRMINNKKLTEAGYNNKRVVFIPVKDWDIDPKTKMWMYTKDINPISLLYRIMNKNFASLKENFKDVDFVFITNDAYFKINFNRFTEKDKNKFLILIRKLRNNSISDTDSDVEDDTSDSKRAIKDTILDKIEDDASIKISGLTGDGKTIEKDKDTEPADAATKPDKQTEEKNIKKKEDLVKKIDDAVINSDTVDDAMAKLDEDEYFKNLLADLADDEENEVVQINKSRAARMDNLNNEFLKKKVQGKTVDQILEDRKAYNDKNLPVSAIPVDSINKEWQELTYVNANTLYDPADDIVAMLYAFKDKTYPLSVRDISVEDTSTSEDYIYTYAVAFESHDGKRFSIKFDVPKFKNKQYMMLRGNKKVISSQSFLMPVLKTEEDAVQIISNYNKIFIRKFGTSLGKSNEYADRIIKTLTKNEFKDIKVVTGDNSKVCAKYDVPIDYIDLSSAFTTIETKNRIIYFNMDAFMEKYKDKITDINRFNCIYDKRSGKIESIVVDDGLFFAKTVMNILIEDSSSFQEAYDKTNKSSRYTYSKASILNTEIPVIVVAAYLEGLTTTLDKAKISYTFVEKKSKDKGIYDDFIKFSDGFLLYENTYASSLLLNGLKACSTELYSVKDVNKKSMYVDFLDGFGGRIKADGLDNFYDCMLDPITLDILEHYSLPTDFVELLCYASSLLADNKFYKHGDMSARRIRRNEIIAGYAYKALTDAYGVYSRNIKHGRAGDMTMKQSAIIDLILLDPTSSDSSFINPLAEMESYNTVSTKGLSGMNSDRSYSLDKRSYDDSMINVLGMSTGFAGNVGISRQATINANINTVRGYVQPAKQEDMNSINSLCMTEALTPLGSTRDDPFRTAMTFIQTNKHTIRVKHSDPCLVTNGASQALPYMISDLFAFKAKNKGKVVEFAENDFMVIQYNTGDSEYIDLSSKIEKNSAAGFYQVIKLDTDLKLGSTVKAGDIVAYDKLAFNNRNGMNNNLEYNIGTLVKCAMLDTDEGFEDSAIISDTMSEAMSSEIVVKKEVSLPANTNIYKLLEPGTPIEEGDTLMIMQTPFDEEDANTLLKTLVDDPEEISDLGRIPIKSKVTGIVQDVEIYRTVELDELSDSLRKVCQKYEKNIKHKKSIMKKYNINQEEELPPDYKLPATGKLKGTIDGVQIVFYLKYDDKMSVGDKLVFYSANKGVVKGIFPKGKEPYCLSDPSEKLHTILSIASANGRMITSIQNVGILQHLLVEATKKAKDMAGIPYDYNKLD